MTLLFKQILNLGFFSKIFFNFASKHHLVGEMFNFFLSFYSKLKMVIRNYNFIFILKP